MNGLDLIKSICARNKLGDDGVAKVIDNLLWFGGHDMHALTRDMIVDGLAAAPDANWEELWWSMQEVCTSYVGTPNGDLGSLTTVGACVVAVILAQTTRKGLGSGYELSGLLGALHRAAWELERIDIVETLKFVVDELSPPAQQKP